MTQEQLQAIFKSPDIKANVEALQVEQVTVKSWSDLEKEYDPTQHPINDKALYPEPKTEGQRKVSLRRITLSEQKLSASLMTGYCVGTPVFRNYELPKNEAGEVEQKYVNAKNLMEAVYQGAGIEQENIHRIHKLFSTCQIATVWYSKAVPTMYAGKEYNNTILCKTYSADTCNLWPQFDRYDNLLGIGIEYERKEKDITTTYFDLYTKDGVKNYSKVGERDWVDITAKEITVNTLSVAYSYRPTPIWEDTSQATYAKEEMLTYTNFYIRQNSDPKEVYLADESTLDSIREQINDAKEKGLSFSAAVRQIFMEKGSNFFYAQYEGATKAVEFMTQQLRDEQNRCLQLFDLSEKSVSNISTETFRLMMNVAEMKVKEEAGRLIKLFRDEEKAIRAHIYAMVTEDVRKTLEAIKIEHEIIPFTVQDVLREVQINSEAISAGIKSKKRAISEMYPGQEDIIMREIEEELAAEQNAGLEDIGINDL